MFETLVNHKASCKLTHQAWKWSLLLHVLKKQVLFFFLLLSSVVIVVNDVYVATTWIVVAAAPARLRSPPPHSQVTLMCLRHLSRTRHHVNTHIKLGSCLDFCQFKQKSWLFFVLLLAFLLVGLAVVGLCCCFFVLMILVIQLQSIIAEIFLLFFLISRSHGRFRQHSLARCSIG